MHRSARIVATRKITRVAASIFTSMEKKNPQMELQTRHFVCADDFERFLEEEHDTCPGMFVKFAKKASAIQSMSSAEGIEVALCFGWIDGRANSIDEKWWTVRYTPRRAKSMWSQKNVSTVTRLLAEKRMRPAGIAAVEAAKMDGRWERAYAGPATITVPQDLLTALSNNEAATKRFHILNKTKRYTVLWKIETATPSSRVNRINSLVQTLAEGAPLRPHAERGSKGKTNSGFEKRNKLEVESQTDRKKRQLDDRKAMLPRRTGLRSHLSGTSKTASRKILP